MENRNWSEGWDENSKLSGSNWFEDGGRNALSSWSVGRNDTVVTRKAYTHRAKDIYIYIYNGE